MNTYFHQHRKPLLHVAFWGVYASFFFYQISFGRGAELDWGRILPDFTFQIGSLAALSYLNYFVFLPRLLADKHLYAYLIRFIPIFIASAYLILIGKRAILRATMNDPSWMYSGRFGANIILGALMVTMFVGLLRFVEDYFEHEARRTELENAQLTSELKFLRAQVNPHFLFNTLNNLYYLAINESPQTSEVIAKLAGLMRYLLYDSNHVMVALDKEVEYMRNYIDLERLRLDDEISVSFDVDGYIEGVRVVPLVLVTFLENAFKHGISNVSTHSFIEVRLRIEDSVLHFEVINSKVPNSEKTVTESSGIGLVNAHRRLELAYPGTHRLDVEDNDTRYTVSLELDLVSTPQAVLA